MITAMLILFGLTFLVAGFFCVATVMGSDRDSEKFAGILFGLWITAMFVLDIVGICKMNFY